MQQCNVFVEPKKWHARERRVQNFRTSVTSAGSGYRCVAYHVCVYSVCFEERGNGLEGKVALGVKRRRR